MAELRFERRGAAALLTFNRPDAHNAMTFAMYEALEARCEEVDADDGVRVLVLRGSGGRAFVAGTDIAEFRSVRDGQEGIAYEARVDRAISRLERVGKPTVAVVEGHALGGGLALAAACDLRLCTPSAEFGMPIARTLGNCLSMENYARLAALLGEGRVKDVVFRARTVGAEEAVAIGLVTEIVAPGELEERVAELCERLAGHAPITLRATKEALRRLRTAGLPDGDDLVREAYGSRDFQEAVEAFLAKRPHEWRGG